MPYFRKVSPLFILLLVSLVLRIFLAFHFEGTGDSGGWRLAGKTGLHSEQYGMGNGTVYDGDCPLLCANWPPITYHYYLGMRWIYENLNPFHLPQWGFYKLLPIITSTIIIYIIYRYSLKYKLKKPFFLASLYAFHPLSLYISGYHGQRESSWLLFLLLSAILLKLKKYLLLAIAFALGASIKIPPLLFSPLFLLKLPTLKKKIMFLIIIPIIFFLLSIPEIIFYTENVIKQVFFYPGWDGWWGLSGISTKLSMLSGNPEVVIVFKPINNILLYYGILLASFYFYKKRTDIMESILGIIMVIFILSPIYANQYMLWPLPFLILLYRKYTKYFWLYSSLGLFAAINSYSLFGIKILEKYFLQIPQEYIYYKIPYLSYPTDLYIPLWIISIVLLVKIVRNNNKPSISSFS